MISYTENLSKNFLWGLEQFQLLIRKLIRTVRSHNNRTLREQLSEEVCIVYNIQIWILFRSNCKIECRFFLRITFTFWYLKSKLLSGILIYIYLSISQNFAEYLYKANLIQIKKCRSLWQKKFFLSSNDRRFYNSRFLDVIKK